MRRSASSTLLAVLLACGAACPATAADVHPRTPTSARPDTAPLPLTRDADRLFTWVTQARDNHGLPFLIIDKKQAHLWVFDAAGRLRGDAPVLLGSARGDHTLPGIGSMKLAEIRPQDRTTPAGRFVAERGTNERGEQVVWVDYDAAVSMHPVLTTNPREQRQHRLDTPTPADNRISFGCINVPTRFHADVVLGTVKQGRSVVYVLPDVEPLRAVFPQLGSRPLARN